MTGYASRGRQDMVLVTLAHRAFLPVVRAGRFGQEDAAALSCLALSRVWRRIIQRVVHSLLQHHRSPVR